MIMLLFSYLFVAATMLGVFALRDTACSGGFDLGYRLLDSATWPLILLACGVNVCFSLIDPLYSFLDAEARTWR